MDHETWAHEIKDLRSGTERTSADWNDLFQRTKVARKIGISDWHVQQTMGNYSDHLRAEKQLSSAAELEMQIAENAESDLRYWREAAVGSFTQAALDYFELGDIEKAVGIGKQALKLRAECDDETSGP